MNKELFIITWAAQEILGHLTPAVLWSGSMQHAGKGGQTQTTTEQRCLDM